MSAYDVSSKNLKDLTAAAVAVVVTAVAEAVAAAAAAAAVYIYMYTYIYIWANPQPRPHRAASLIKQHASLRLYSRAMLRALPWS